MKRFEFRLESLLRLRRQQLKQIEAELQRAQQAVDVVNSQIEAQKHSLNQAAVSLKSAVDLQDGSFQQVSDWARTVHFTIVQLTTQKATAELKVTQVASERSQKATEVEALENLRENRRLEYKKEQERLRQIVTDDDTLRRWNLQARSASE